MPYRPLLAMALFIILAGPSSPSARAASPTPQFFAETGHVLADPLQTFWMSNGGLPVFGYPLSEAFDEQHNDAQGMFWTQYFERNRLEAHPENSAPYDVLLGRLGVEALEQQGRRWQSFPKASPDAPHFFAPTGQAIAHAPFWAYWSSHGLEFDGQAGTSEAESLALWGYPVSPPSMETNSSGDRVLTQWFERARFEDHGAKGVLLGLLGNELTAERKDEPPFRRVEGPGNVARTDLGGKLAFVRGGDTWLYRPSTGEVRKLLDDTSDFRWSADGTAIAFVRADGLYVADADGGNIRQVYAGRDTHRPRWSSDGAKLAFVRGAYNQAPDGTVEDTRTVWTVESRSGQARQVAVGFDPAWDPAGDRLAYVTVVTGTGPVETNPGYYNPGRNELRVVGWQGQGDRAIVRELPSTFANRDNLPREALGHAMEQPFWDPSGASIYVVSAVAGLIDGTLYLLERANAASGGSTVISELGNVGGMTPSPDARVVLLGQHGLGGGPWFEAHAIDGNHAAWRWASTQQDPTEQIWPVAPTWAPDGKAVVYSRCEFWYGPTSIASFCSLAALTPGGAATLVPSIRGPLDWGR